MHTPTLQHLNAIDTPLAFARAHPFIALVDLPVTLLLILRALFRKLCGDDWFRAGLNVATAFIGSFATVLYEKSAQTTTPRAWAYRVLTWPIALLGLAWFALGGYWALMLIPMLRMGKYLHEPPEDLPEGDWRAKPLLFPLEKLDYVSFGVMAVSTLLLFLALPHLFPKPPDAYYHLQVAFAIAESGTVPLWDDWSYAPIGRPHLYPPLYHILIYLASFLVGGDIVGGVNLLNVIWPTTIYFSTWYFARWLFDARRALLAMLLCGATFDIISIAYRVLPSLMAGNLALFAMIFILKKRPFIAATCVTAGLYTHTGIMPQVLVGLVLFALVQRSYLRTYFIALAVSLLLFAPWLIHVIRNAHWFHAPDTTAPLDSWLRIFEPFENLFWLLTLNIVLVLLVVRGAPHIQWKETRNQLLITQLLAFLPMLINYGGRYFMHTTQVWVIFAAIPLVHLLNPPLHNKRIALILLLALAPILLFTGPAFGPGPKLGGPLGFAPMVSSWTFPFLEAIGGRNFVRARFNLPPNSYDEAKDAAEYISPLTNPDQIVHSFGDGELALRIATLARRPMSNAGWVEVHPPQEDLKKVFAQAANDPRGIYVTLDAEKKAEGPDTLLWHQVGRVWVGLPADQIESPESATLESDTNPQRIQESPTP